MIGIRVVTCDWLGCDRHFEVDGRELDIWAAVDMRNDRAAVCFARPRITFPQGWAVGEEDGRPIVLCADHARGA